VPAGLQRFDNQRPVGMPRREDGHGVDVCFEQRVQRIVGFDAELFPVLLCLFGINIRRADLVYKRMRHKQAHKGFGKAAASQDADSDSLAHF